MPMELAFPGWLPGLYAALILFIWAGTAGLGFLNSTCLLRYASGKPVFNLLLARQAMPAILAANALRLLALAFCVRRAASHVPDANSDAMLMAGIGLGILSAACGVLHFLSVLLARRKKTIPGLVAALVAGTADFVLTALFLILIRPVFSTAETLEPLAAFSSLAFFAVIIILSPAAGASLAQLRVLARRTEDDFGRDYYSFALRACSKNGLFSASIAIIPAFTAIWLLSALSPAPSNPQPPAIFLGAAGLALLLIAALLCLRVWRSATPLRHKAGLFLAPLLLLAVLYCICTALMHLPVFAGLL